VNIRRVLIVQHVDGRSRHVVRRGPQKRDERLERQFDLSQRRGWVIEPASLPGAAVHSKHPTARYIRSPLTGSLPFLTSPAARDKSKLIAITANTIAVSNSGRYLFFMIYALSARVHHDIKQRRLSGLHDRDRALERRRKFVRVGNRTLAVDAKALGDRGVVHIGSFMVVPMSALVMPRPWRAAIASRHM